MSSDFSKLQNSIIRWGIKPGALCMPQPNDDDRLISVCGLTEGQMRGITAVSELVSCIDCRRMCNLPIICEKCKVYHGPEDPKVSYWETCPLCGELAFQLTSMPPRKATNDHKWVVGGQYQGLEPKCLHCKQRVSWDSCKYDLIKQVPV